MEKTPYRMVQWMLRYFPEGKKESFAQWDGDVKWSEAKQSLLESFPELEFSFWSTVKSFIRKIPRYHHYLSAKITSNAHWCLVSKIMACNFSWRIAFFVWIWHERHSRTPDDSNCWTRYRQSIQWICERRKLGVFPKSRSQTKITQTPVL